MSKAVIDGQDFEFETPVTILEAARSIGAFIPTLCHFKDLNSAPGTCGMCLVSVQRPGQEKEIVRSCKTMLEDGMIVDTESDEVLDAQRRQMEFIFKDHDLNCGDCARKGGCELIPLVIKLHARVRPIPENAQKRPVDTSDLSIKFDGNKCITCYRCVEVCKQVTGIGALTIKGIGQSARAGLKDTDAWIDSSLCVRCGQCTLVCPTGALSETPNIQQALDLFEDPDVKTVVQFAPSVRATLGEAFKLKPGTNVEGKVVSALKELGADFVFDTNFSADVTIMEEGTELLNRVRNKVPGPMFTSCCPAWINFVEQKIPELIPHLSTTRSPQGIMASLAKTWLPIKTGIPAEKIRVISIMPCTAKKMEAARPALQNKGLPDTDVVLTVRELAQMIKDQEIEFADLPELEPDTPYMSHGTGAGMIFGRTAGVAEAAIRTINFIVNGEELASDVPWGPSEDPHVHREVELDLEGVGKVKVAAVYGLDNAEAVARDALAGKSPYTFIEVMTCPGGCVNGGGTVRHKGEYFHYNDPRKQVLNTADHSMPVRQSHNNPMVKEVYSEFLKEPNSHMAHELLHTHYDDRTPKPKTPDIRDIWAKVELG